MLCQFCTDLDLDRLEGVGTGSADSSPTSSSGLEDGLPHHASYADLVTSADAGCELCALVRGQHQKNCHGKLDLLLSSEDGRPQKQTQIICKYEAYWDNLEWCQPVLLREDVACLDVKLSAYTTEDNPMAALISAREIHTDVSSRACRDIAIRWMGACFSHHEGCPAREARELPSRVIDVGDLKTDPHLTISNGLRGEWVALSYCWVEPPHLRTELNTLDNHKRGIPLAQMPPTLRDAVRITRGLGFRYLWIDALCIIQDSREDWIAESTKMGHIYKNAVVTILAEASPDIRAGIFGSSSQGRQSTCTSSVRVPCFSSRHAVKGDLYCLSTLLASSSSDSSRGAYRINQGPLSGRAWALQEDLLSFRVLRFASDQIRWRCHEAEWTERYPEASPDQDFLTKVHSAWDTQMPFTVTTDCAGYADMLEGFTGPDRQTPSQNPALQKWYNLVNTFTLRRIRFPKDRLPAIDGLAAEIHRQTGYDYKAGLWLDDIHTGLLWSSPGPGATKPADATAPSWSWASVDFADIKEGPYGAKVVYQNAIIYQPLVCMADIRTIESKGPDTSVGLWVRGNAREICRCQIPVQFLDCYSEDIWTPNFNSVITTDELPETSCVAKQTCSEEAHNFCKPLLYMEIKKYFPQWCPTRTTILALILEHAGDEEKDEQYVRVGMAILREDQKVMNDWSQRVLIII